MKQLALDIETKQLIAAWMEIAFLAGRWHWQVDLEESMDSNFGDALQSSIHAKKTGMPLHTVAGGLDDSKPVRYFLRSNEWRSCVIKSSRESLERATEQLTNALAKRDGWEDR